MNKNQKVLLLLLIFSMTVAALGIKFVESKRSDSKDIEVEVEEEVKDKVK